MHERTVVLTGIQHVHLGSLRADKSSTRSRECMLRAPTQQNNALKLFRSISRFSHAAIQCQLHHKQVASNYFRPKTGDSDSATILQIYYTEPDFEAYARSVKDPEDVVSSERNHWAFGECQTVKARLCLHVPGLQSQHPDSYRQGGQTLWVDDSQSVVFTAVCGSVFAFSLVDGSCVASWERIHTQHVSAFLYLPDRHQAVSVCEAPKAIVWKVQSWKPKYICTFGAFTSLVTALQRVPDSPSVVVANQDGSLKMWCMETFQPQVSIKVGSGISYFCFASKQCGVLWHGRTAHVLWLRCMFPPFFNTTSTAISLERASLESVLVRFEDDSARLLDAQTGKVVMSVPPQLASQSVNSCALSSFSQTIYMLLSSSVVHVWQPVPHTDRTQLVGVWTQHRRSRLVTLCIAPQETVPSAQLRSWGLPPARQEDEFLFGGTADGDVWIMDRSTGAQMISFCAHKLCGIKHILCDPELQRVLTTAGSAARVWSFKNGVTSMGTTNLVSDATSTALCGSHFVIGTASGAVHIVESHTGLCAITLACAVHTGAVNSIEADSQREWLVSTSSDGTVKVWNLSGAVIYSLQNTRQVACACFLNGNPDLLLGAPTQLEKVRLEDYDPHTNVQCTEEHKVLFRPETQSPAMLARELQVHEAIEKVKQMTLTNTTNEEPVIVRMMETNIHQIPVLGSGPELAHAWSKDSARKAMDKACLQSSDKIEATSSEDKSFRALVLGHAVQCCEAVQKQDDGESMDSRVEGALKPPLKKALQVLQDPDMFWNGTTPPKPKNIKGRKRRTTTKRGLPGKITHLSNSAREDPCVRKAVKEVEANNQQLKLSLHQAAR
eukprot:jgi/Ulvmu1/4432/UM002_0157.1